MSLKYFILSIIVSACISLFIAVIFIPVEKKPVEKITFWTVEDAYYLQHNRVWDYEGAIDYTFDTREEAIQYYEHVSLAVSKEVMRTIDSLNLLTNKIRE